MNTPDTPTPRTDGAVWSPYEETIVVVVDADFACQLERELTAAKGQVAALETAREVDFEVFHEMRMKLTAACGDPYKLHPEALDAVLAELALLRKRVEAADGLLKRINEDPAMSKRGGAGGQDHYAGTAPMHRHIDMYFAAYRAASCATEGKR